MKILRSVVVNAGDREAAANDDFRFHRNRGVKDTALTQTAVPPMRSTSSAPATSGEPLSSRATSAPALVRIPLHRPARPASPGGGRRSEWLVTIGRRSRHSDGDEAERIRPRARREAEHAEAEDDDVRRPHPQAPRRCASGRTANANELRSCFPPSPPGEGAERVGSCRRITPRPAASRSQWRARRCRNFVGSSTAPLRLPCPSASDSVLSTRRPGRTAA